LQELRLWSGETAVSVRYGSDLEEETQRLLKHAHRKAIEKAWEQEKHYISLGLDGRRAWTEEEKDQLLSKGQVHGYRPSDLFSIHKFPQLADDPNNVLFQKESRRKRRKSNKRHHSSYGSSSSSSSSSSSEEKIEGHEGKKPKISYKMWRASLEKKNRPSGLYVTVSNTNRNEMRVESGGGGVITLSMF